MNGWKTRFFPVLLTIILVGPFPSGAEGSTPARVVETLHAALIESMKQSDTLGYEDRFERLAPTLSASFDLDFMAQKSVGRTWKKLDEAERTRWLQAFERHTTANYAGRFTGYSGQRFETLGTEAAAHDTMVVRTKLINPDDDDVELNYRLRQTPSGWRIIDVYLNGTVSELALRRSEYSSVLKREGFDTLIANLDRKSNDLANASVE